jgi:galactose-1-phosphate uridylyltransferase
MMAVYFTILTKRRITMLVDISYEEAWALTEWLKHQLAMTPALLAQSEAYLESIHKAYPVHKPGTLIAAECVQQALINKDRPRFESALVKFRAVITAKIREAAAKHVELRE